MEDPNRIVITGVGLTSPYGDTLDEFRTSLLAGKSGVVQYETRYMGAVLAGVCCFDEFQYIAQIFEAMQARYSGRKL